MSDWQPTRLPISNTDWETNDILQIMLQENPARISSQELINIQRALNPEPLSTSHPAVRDGLGGFQNAPTSVHLDGYTFTTDASISRSFLGSGKALDLQQGLVDFVRYFLPGGEFDPDSASSAFDLGMVLLRWMTLLLAFPGGAVLVHSLMTALGREVPNLGPRLSQQNDLSQFEDIDQRLEICLKDLLLRFTRIPYAPLRQLQEMRGWIDTIAEWYRSLEDSGLLDQPDFLSHLFQYISNLVNGTLYPRQIPALTGLVFYFLSGLYAQENPERSQQLFEAGEILIDGYETLDLAGELELLRQIDTFDDFFRTLDDIPLEPLNRLLTIKDGVEGGIQWGEAVSDLLDPALNPNNVGNQIWPRRLEVMFTGIEGILKTGFSIVSLAGPEVILAFAGPFAAGIFLCALLIWVTQNWDWISAGLRAWRDNWNMLTQVILPYRGYQAWQWFDNTIGRTVRDNILQPIGRWAENTWNSLMGRAQSLAGE